MFCCFEDRTKTKSLEQTNFSKALNSSRLLSRRNFLCSLYLSLSFSLFSLFSLSLFLSFSLSLFLTLLPLLSLPLFLSLCVFVYHFILVFLYLCPSFSVCIPNYPLTFLFIYFSFWNCPQIRFTFIFLFCTQYIFVLLFSIFDNPSPLWVFYIYTNFFSSSYSQVFCTFLYLCFSNHLSSLFIAFSFPLLYLQSCIPFFTLH